VAVRERLETSGCQLHAYLSCDRGAQLTFQSQDVPRLPIVRARPDLNLIARAYEFGRDTKVVAFPANRALQQVIGFELPADVQQGLRRPFVGKGRRPADDAQSRWIKVAECRRRFLRQPIGDVLSSRITAEILKGSTAIVSTSRPRSIPHVTMPRSATPIESTTPWPEGVRSGCRGSRDSATARSASP
jgi:hypothetical protein